MQEDFQTVRRLDPDYPDGFFKLIDLLAAVDDVGGDDVGHHEDVIEEKEVFFPPSRPGPLHQQSFRQKTSAFVGYLYSRGAEDILWIISVRSKEPEIKLLCRPVSW